MKKYLILILTLIFIVGCTQQTQTIPKTADVETGGEAKVIVEEPLAPAPLPKDVPLPPGAGEPPEFPATPEPISTTTNVKEFTMTAKKFEFEPSTITVNKGDTVKLTITSTDVAHGFAISEFGVSERLKPGETVEVEFVADKSGTFDMFCNVFCGSGHRDMRGTLIVE